MVDASVAKRLVQAIIDNPTKPVPGRRPVHSGGTIRSRGLPQFVWTRGGAYTFLPSLSAIRFLGSQMM
ncbi:hypothetical protein Q3C01_41655 [Bradyrhizobium sp. UFLA05-109]